MGTSFLKVCTFGGVLCAVAWGSGFAQAAGGGGYLPSTGPVPLRFAAEKPPAKPCELPQLAMQDPPPPTSPSPEASVPSDANLGTDELVAVFDKDPLDLPPPAPLDTVPAAPETATTQPASDVLVVTPQMLVDYFKPIHANGNGANATVVVPLGFTPPTASVGSSPPSRATYRTQ